MLLEIKKQLQKFKKSSVNADRFFKTGAGEYAEHDRFIGVSVPDCRKIAREHYLLPLSDAKKLIRSKFNEERLLALLILVNRYQKNKDEQQIIYDFYFDHMNNINNWNLVDASAHLIVGAHLFNKNKTVLETLAKSSNLWERRIAIVSTWYFIRQNKFEYTVKIAKILLNDQHDLIHKSVGWMLREMGKKNQSTLVNFLEKYAHKMPRTMLRYAIEKFPESERKKYLKITKK